MSSYPYVDLNGFKKLSNIPKLSFIIFKIRKAMVIGTHFQSLNFMLKYDDDENNLLLIDTMHIYTVVSFTQ